MIVSLPLYSNTDGSKPTKNNPIIQKSGKSFPAIHPFNFIQGAKVYVQHTISLSKSRFGIQNLQWNDAADIIPIGGVIYYVSHARIFLLNCYEVKNSNIKIDEMRIKLCI